ncbi:flagellar biosynthetic protein FliR [Cohnella hashimotonis]|uniref:Flagellar biosynthetic protein FliR n=1 Tax=Cohnella hashimotonis TaxID=2826895 RepID=A0ABT6TH85_9BACL|nr:flagellar biosynthetic protein FliR [Cohnella hashimotonis]MDI4646206.1 flagellar biosynthetic protein FliR [Cohnella hashimotonis]
MTTEAIMQVVPAYMLVLCRISAFIVVAPVFSSRNIPGPFKAGISVFIALLVFLTVGFDQAVPTDATYIFSIFKEILAGLVIGYTASLFFTLIQTAGTLIDIQMGLGIANILDPVSGVSAPLFGNLKYMMMILVFLSINGHHYLLGAIMNSYKWLPLNNDLFGSVGEGRITEFLVRTFADTFLLALQISTPIVVAMFLTDFGLGLLARTAPQYNVFVIGIPLKILIGLALLILLLPGFTTIFQIVFDRMFDALEKLFVIMKTT